MAGRENYKVNPPEESHKWTEEEFDRISQYLERLTQAKPEYGGAYVPGECYTQGDMVSGNAGLYVANTDTCDSPDPVFQGEGLFVYDGNSPVSSEIAKTLIFGTRYIFQKTLSFSRYKIYTIAGYTYTIYSVENPGTSEVITQHSVFTATVTGWVEYGATPRYIPAGSVYDLVVVVSEPADTPTTWDGQWDYKKPNNPTVPAKGQAIHSTKTLDLLEVSKFDYTAYADRSAELLALQPGDRIVLGATTWSIFQVIDDGEYVTFVIAPATHAAGAGPNIFYFETVTETPIARLKEDNWWDTHYPGDVFGLYMKDGNYKDIIPDANAYGVDIFLQAVDRSDDWDIMLPGEGGGSPVNPQLTYDYMKVNGIIDIPDTYTPLATLVTPNRVQGIYELKLSMSWVFDRTTNSAFFRWRETDELGVFSPWNETVQEPKDKTDTNNTFYAYPTEWGGGVKRVEIEARKETGAGILDVSYLDIVFERKL